MRRSIINFISVCSVEMKDVFSLAYHKVRKGGETAMRLHDNNLKPEIFSRRAATHDFFVLSINLIVFQ